MVHKVYYEIRALFSSNKSQIYIIEKHEQVEVIVFYKPVMDSIFFFNPTVPKIGHKLSQTGSSCVYVHTKYYISKYGP